MRTAEQALLLLLLAVSRSTDGAMVYRFLAKEVARAAEGDSHACSKVEVVRTNMVGSEVGVATALYRRETKDGPNPGQVRLSLEEALRGSCPVPSQPLLSHPREERPPLAFPKPLSPPARAFFLS
jgi:hypothetical protein